MTKVDLLEIMRRRVSVVVAGDKQIEVGGLSAHDIAALAERFKNFGEALARIDIDPQTALQLGPQVVGAIIAAGCGRGGDEAYEAHAADNLDAGDQLNLLFGIFEATFSGGVRPFAERLQSLFGIRLLGGAASHPTSSPGVTPVPAAPADRVPAAKAS